VRDKVSHPYKTTGKIIVLYILIFTFLKSILAGFKNCCFSNALDGTEDDILWQDVEDENDDSDCEDGGDEQSDREDSK
jgi:hypothetical protein